MRLSLSVILVGILLWGSFAFGQTTAPTVRGDRWDPNHIEGVDPEFPPIAADYAEAWFGGTIASEMSERGAIQITCGGTGGCYLMEYHHAYPTAQATGQRLHYSAAATDPLAADPLSGSGTAITPTMYDIGTGTIQSTIEAGNTSVILDGTHPNRHPGVSGGQSEGFPLKPFYFANGSLLTLYSRAVTEPTNWAVRLREVNAVPDEFAWGMSGGSCGAIASEAGSFQLDCQAPGGCFVQDVWMYSDIDETNGVGYIWDVALDGTDPFAVDALTCAVTALNFSMGTIATTSTVLLGTTTVNLAATDPTFPSGIVVARAQGAPLQEFYIPNGALFSMQALEDEEHSDWVIIWREVL